MLWFLLLFLNLVSITDPVTVPFAITLLFTFSAADIVPVPASDPAGYSFMYSQNKHSNYNLYYNINLNVYYGKITNRSI